MSDRTPSLRKREHRSKRVKDIRRDIIIDDALVLLLRDGRRAMTMEEIAKYTELSIGSLYKYFPNGRVELYDKLVDRLVTTDALDRAFDPDKTPIEELAGIGQAYLDFGLSHPGYFQLVAQPKVFGPLSDAQAERVAARVSKLIDRVAAVIERGQSPDLPDGERFAEGLDARNTAEVLHGAWNGLLGLSVRGDALERNGDELTEFARLLTQIVRNGMVSGPSGGVIPRG
jgi:AcrR family transcriptional regulator